MSTGHDTGRIEILTSDCQHRQKISVFRPQPKQYLPQQDYWNKLITTSYLRKPWDGCKKLLALEPRGPWIQAVSRRPVPVVTNTNTVTTFSPPPLCSTLCWAGDFHVSHSCDRTQNIHEFVINFSNSLIALLSWSFVSEISLTQKSCARYFSAIPANFHIEVWRNSWTSWWRQLRPSLDRKCIFLLHFILQKQNFLFRDQLSWPYLAL